MKKLTISSLDLPDFTTEEFSILFEHEIYRPYSNLLYSTLLKAANNDTYTTDEVFQITMIHLWQNLRTVLTSWDIRTYILRIAMNEFGNYKAKNTHKWISMNSNEDLYLLIAENTMQNAQNRIENYPISLEERYDIMKCIYSMRSDYYTVIMLHYYGDFTFKEIAAIMDANYNTVVSWHRRAIRQLGFKLADKKYQYLSIEFPRIHVYMGALKNS